MGNLGRKADFLDSALTEGAGKISVDLEIILYGLLDVVRVTPAISHVENHINLTLTRFSPTFFLFGPIGC